MVCRVSVEFRRGRFFRFTPFAKAHIGELVFCPLFARRFHDYYDAQKRLNLEIFAWNHGGPSSS
jgi:hypothetical protein